MAAPAPLPPATDQAERLVELGLCDAAGVDVDGLREVAALTPPGSLLALHPERVPIATLASLVEHREKPGFVVTDMTDVDEFAPIPEVGLPVAAAYVLTDIDRGDHLSNWSPDEALPEIVGAGRTPLLLSEGLYWLLQQPAALDRNHCFMTIGSRLRKPAGRLDARTPAVWISNGTGRDGRANRDAPKVGWCWAGNRHTWLGFASAATRSGLSS